MAAPHRLFDLTGRTALITGSSQGLGLAFARGLGQAGAAYGFSYIFPHTAGHLSGAVRIGRHGARDRRGSGLGFYQAASSRVRMTAAPSILRGFV